MAGPVNIADYQQRAKKRLPHMLWEYLEGGSYAEATLRRNVDDLAALNLRQRVMRDGSTLRMASKLFGQSVVAPIVLAPVGFSGMFARRGEVQAAKAAKAASIPICLSSLSVCGIEEVVERSGMMPWFQLYMIRDRDYMIKLLDRVRRSGVKVLFFTVDLATPASRYRDARSGMHDVGLRGMVRRGWQGARRPRWLWDVFLGGRPHSFGHFHDAIEPGRTDLGAYWQWMRANFDPGVTWADIRMVREYWQGPLVIKGILDPEDARLALDSGADGIIVSNHGGRQLDGVRSTISALPGIVDVVGGTVPVLMDGGIRSGLDILKALALGAKGVMIGRAWAYALAVDGERGVSRMLQILMAELRVAMILAGCADLADASREFLDRAPR